MFEIVVEAGSDSNPGMAGCVLQLPNGFQVVGHSGPDGTITRDEPALIGLYTAEPGHFLASWSGGNQSAAASITLKLFVRAPATVTAGVVKVALAAHVTQPQYTALSPTGVFDFASITASTNAQTVLVLEDPPIPFVPDDDGLPPPGMQPGPFGSEVSAAHFADWNGDGDDDLVATSLNALHTWARTGAAWTPTPNPIPAFFQANSLAVGDFDGDGFLDIAQGAGQVFFGDGAGGWVQGAPLPLPNATRGVAAGDFDGDGRDDLAFSGYYLDHLIALRGNANRTFTPASNGLPTSFQPLTTYQPLLRDVTGDGLVDLVATEVFAGDGQGNWTAGSGIGNGSWGTATGDLDGDGLPEVVCANPNLAGARVYKHLGNNQWGQLQPSGLPNRYARKVAIADFDRDGRDDLAIGFWTGGVELWRNLGGLSFQRVADSGLPEIGTTVVDLAVGDVNGDTFPDLVTIVDGDGLRVWQNWLGGASPFGDACQGNLPQPVVVQTDGAPALGNQTFAVEVAAGPPGALGFVWLGTSRHAWAGLPLPIALDVLGAPGCALWTSQEAVTFGLFDAQGELGYALPIPNQPALLRYTFFAQGAAYAPGSNALDLAFSAGMAVRLQ